MTRLNLLLSVAVIALASASEQAVAQSATSPDPSGGNTVLPPGPSGHDAMAHRHTGRAARKSASRTNARADAAPSTPETMVVTGTRRPSIAQRTPVSIAVLSSKELREHNISTIDQIATLVPGLKIDVNGSRGYTFIRGIGSDAVSIGSDPSVATYSDGVYQPRGASALGALWDVNHVEVLKGPQGTTYGRDATGGAMILVNNQPEIGLNTGYADVGYGSFNRVRVEGAENAPIGDKVAVRISGMYQTDDGYLTNVANNKSTGGQTIRGVRATALYQMDENTSFKVESFYSRITGSRGATFKVDPSQPAPSVQKFGFQVPAGTYDVDYNSPNEVTVNNYGVSATAQTRFRNVQVQDIAGFQHIDANRVLDFDATGLNLATTFEGLEKSTAYTNSLQFNNADPSRFEWIAGVDYIHEDLYQDVVSEVYPRTSPSTIRASVSDDAVGVFGNVKYEILPGVKISAGLRYSDETKDFFLTSAESASWHALTPQFGLEYHPLRNVMLYATATNGFKSGGFNSNLQQPPFSQEKIWSYETGIKTTLFHNRVIANLDAFYYDYKDLQVTQIDPATSIPMITNAGTAQVHGLEGQLEGRIWRQLRGGIDFALLDTRYGSLNLQNTSVIGSPIVNVGGNSFSRAPKTSIGTNLSYRFTLPDNSTLTFGGDAHYVSRTYFTPFEDNNVSQAGFVLANARVVWNKKRWELSVLCNNLTNQFYKITEQAYPTSTGTTYLIGESRYVGGQVRYGW